ncbi:MAG: ABC transporter ATP-binding protein [Thermodesulfobacteriota bacterium]
MDTIIKAEGIFKSYRKNGEGVEVLKGIDLALSPGDMAAIIGASGVGKSTLLHILGALDTPTSGEVFFNNTPLFKQNERELALYRNKKVGFVFQFHNLLLEFNALENASMPCLIGGMNKRETMRRAEQILIEVGLKDRLKHKPGELSGGEQQRVAVARALVQSPDILLADEPTGNLDTTTGMEVMDILLKLNRDRGLTLIVVTHNEDIAQRFPRKIRMVDGRVHEE